MSIKRIICITLFMILFMPFIVNAKSQYLYDVLKDEAESGGLAREYTGEHHDSFTEEPSKKIYHWYGSNNTNGTAIQDKNNVIFANHCWQMIRTTDTGGVKMIYNGEAENNQCLNTRGNHVGYVELTSQSLNSNYWYGTDYTYDKTNNVFSIAGTTEQTTWNATTGPNLIGKYTCRQTTETGTCATLYLVKSYYSTSNALVITLNSSSHYSQFGTLQFNVNYNSPSYVGYMYNTVYPYSAKMMTSSETMLSSSSLATTYWYGDNVTWGSPTVNRYNLGNPSQVTSTDDYPSLVGKYTFRNTSQTYTNTSVYYIAAVNGSTMYYINLTNTGNHTLADFNYTYTYGDSYTDNGNGTYIINNPTTINRSDWYTSYSSVGAGKYVCKNATNNTCSDLWYTTSTSNTSMTYIPVANNYKYAKGFEYRLDPDDNTYKYFLDDSTSTTFWNINDSTNKTNLNNAHYTCWNESGKCTTISYIYYINGITPYYINIADGKSVEDAKNEMLYDDNVNTTNSTIKSGVDAWYKQYLSDYSDYLEDTIFCNDRSQSNQSNNGWNPNGGSTSTYMYFYGASDLSCPNETDKFSVSNNKAKLTYKVGLMSYREMNLLNNSNTRKTGQYYWLASPSYFINYCVAYEWGVGTSGNMNSNVIGLTNGVRPAVSLKSSARVISGNGSTSNPYQLSFNSAYSVNVQVVNETKNIDINIEDMSNVSEGEEVTFKVTPIDGYKLTSIKIIDSDNHEITFTETGVENQYKFTMPASDVTIIPSYRKNRFNISVTIKNEEKDFDINVEDMTSVLVGEEVTFKVTPITGYKVNNIQIIDSDNHDVVFAETGNDNEYNFVMPESDVTIIPSYERVSSSIEVEDNTHTKEIVIEVDDISAVVYEDAVLFTVVPEKGYEVDFIDIKDQDNNKIDYQKTDNKNEYSFIMPASDVTITPSYKKVKNSVNVLENDSTKELIIEVNDSEAVVYEDTVKFTVVPEDGYELDNIEITDKDGKRIEYKKTDKDNEYEFIMPDTDVVIKPIYKKIAETSNNNIIIPFLNPKTKRNIFFMLIIIFLFGTVIYKKKRVV